MADGSSEKDIFAHQEWLGFVQPIGVVVAPTVMVDAQVVLDSHITPRRRELCDLLEEIEGVHGSATRTERTGDFHPLPRLGGRRSGRCDDASRDAREEPAGARRRAVGNLGGSDRRRRKQHVDDARSRRGRRSRPRQGTGRYGLVERDSARPIRAPDAGDGDPHWATLYR